MGAAHKVLALLASETKRQKAARVNSAKAARLKIERTKEEWGELSSRERTYLVQKAYRERNKEKVKQWQKDWNDKNKSYNKKKLRQYAKANPKVFLYNSAKRRASSKGIDFDIDLCHIEIPSHCPVLGIKLEIGVAAKGRNANSMSLDRIDSNKGYIPGNICVISMRANLLKNNGTIKEFEAILHYMRQRLT